SVLLYGAFATHYSLALWALWLRRSLKIPGADGTQLAVGFSVSFFPAHHVHHTGLAATDAGAGDRLLSTGHHRSFLSPPLPVDQAHPRAAPADAARMDEMVVWVRYAFVAALVAVLAARLARSRWQRRRGIVRLTYPSGRVVQIVRGVSVLEASRMAGIPHASV